MLNFSFKRAFGTLEIELREKELIEDFSLTQNTLEQVFIAFSKR